MNFLQEIGQNKIALTNHYNETLSVI